MAIKTSFVNNVLIGILILICLCLLGIVVFLLLFKQLLVPIERLIMKVKVKNLDTEKMAKILRAIYKSVLSFRQHKVALFNVFLVSIFFQMNRIVITYIISLALGIDISFAYWIIIVPLVTLATMLPFSIGGLGVREGSFVFFLGQLSVNVSTAFLLSLVIFFLGSLLVLPGLILYLRGGLVSARGVAPSN
jgi:uncharacterized protein (TIRG00374 family)